MIPFCLKPIVNFVQQAETVKYLLDCKLVYKYLVIDACISKNKMSNTVLQKWITYSFALLRSKYLLLYNIKLTTNWRSETSDTIVWPE